MKARTPHDWRAADLAHVWHPYTPIRAFEAQDFPIVARAEGVYLHTVDGKTLLDGISSWWCVNLGHSQPRIVEAIRRQAGELQHSILGGMSHPRAIELAERLAELTPTGLTRVCFASDGASATEASMRMAIQYWHNVGIPEKNGLVALRDAYHGDTLGAVGVGYVEAFHSPLNAVLRRALQAESPHCFVCPARESCDLRCFESMRSIVEEHAGQLAAVIVEPLCQGAAGMRIYPADYLRELRKLCDRRELLLIADEVAVGFGRTGRLFACQSAGIAPDILCMGKGLTGGTLPMSAVACSKRVFDSFRDTAGSDRTFYHGHTFAGNPIAAAAALAALELYVDEDAIGRSAGLAAQLEAGFERLSRRRDVLGARTLWAMSSLRLAGGAAAARAVAGRAREAGLLIRPLGDVLYLWPPLTTDAEELSRMLEILDDAIGE